MADFTHIRIDRHEDGVAAVVVARADIGNASSPEMLGEVRDAFAALSGERDVRAIIFAAEGKHFSVGADFAFLQRLTGMSASEIKDKPKLPEAPKAELKPAEAPKPAEPAKADAK